MVPNRRKLLSARAIETQSYVVAAAQFGSHNDKRESYGHSLIVDPWGSVIKDAGGVDTLDGSMIETPSIVTCEIDLERVDSIRKRMPIQDHRKSALAKMEKELADDRYQSQDLSSEKRRQ